MMELREFDFEPFSADKKVGSFNQFLSYMNEEDIFDNFPGIGNVIASDVVRAVSFSEFKVCLFVGSLIIFVDHFLKNKKRIDILYQENICKELSNIHALTLIFIRKIFSKKIHQTHSLRVYPLPIIVFSYGAEMCPHLVQLIGHVSALIGYIEI